MPATDVTLVGVAEPCERLPVHDRQLCTPRATTDGQVWSSRVHRRPIRGSADTSHPSSLPAAIRGAFCFADFCVVKPLDTLDYTTRTDGGVVTSARRVARRYLKRRKRRRRAGGTALSHTN